MKSENFAHSRIERFLRSFDWRAVLAIAFAACAPITFAQSSRESHRTLTVSVAEAVSLEVQLSEGELQILYGRDGQVSIAAIAEAPAGAKLGAEFLTSAFVLEQKGNRLNIRQPPHSGNLEGGIKMVYRIDVPYRTEVNSVVEKGRQTITGIMGPVKATGKTGDIKVSYISRSLLVETGSGNLDFQVIGERVEAKTGNGNISGFRAAQGVDAETEDGDIVLMLMGPSKAIVKSGSGRIDVGGARGSFTGLTAGGDLHVKAIPHDNWQLESATGNIRLELPPIATCEVEAATNSGAILIDRDDIKRPVTEVRYIHQKVNGGGKYIEARTDSGKIVIR